VAAVKLNSLAKEAAGRVTARVSHDRQPECEPADPATPTCSAVSWQLARHGLPYTIRLSSLVRVYGTGDKAGYLSAKNIHIKWLIAEDRIESKAKVHPK